MFTFSLALNERVFAVFIVLCYKRENNGKENLLNKYMLWLYFEHLNW